jgi:hypothetical protein
VVILISIHCGRLPRNGDIALSCHFLGIAAPFDVPEPMPSASSSSSATEAPTVADDTKANDGGKGDNDNDNDDGVVIPLTILATEELDRGSCGKSSFSDDRPRGALFVNRHENFEKLDRDDEQTDEVGM